MNDDVRPLTESDIRAVLDVFYAKVRRDPLLGPVFATRIADTDEAWDMHINHIAGFWSSVFLKTGGYKGNPLTKHTALSGLTPEHFKHWLILFEQSTTSVLGTGSARLMSDMAKRIALSLQMGIANHHEINGNDDHAFVEFGLRRGIKNENARDVKFRLPD